MSWGPVEPAHIDFSDALAPSAPAFGDLYHTRAGADGQARHVFLAGNGLPGRWAGRDRFVVLETGFGLGNNFLATWAAWKADPQRCDRLWYVGIEKHPPRRDDLARAQAQTPHPALAAELRRAWPPLTPDLHLLDLDGGRVRLLLAFGDIHRVLPDLVLQANAFYLDGFAPARNPAMWEAHLLRQLPRLAAPGASVATWSVATAVRQGLSAAGFRVDKQQGYDGKREMTVGRFAPRFTPPAPPGRVAQAGVRQVSVVGAGLAGCAVASALAARGLAVTVIDRQPGPARETSGNAGGLFHGVVHAQDGPHARWLRAAALHTARVLRPRVAAGQVPGQVDGLLRGERMLTREAMQRLIDTLALPDDFLRLADWPGPGQGPAWLYPDGGWASPAALCAAWLDAPGITTRFGQAVDALQRVGDRWQLLADGRSVLAEADAVLLCNAADAQRLAGVSAAHWTLGLARGQTTLLPASTAGLPDLPQPLADGGYALQLADGRWLCGATSQRDDADPALRGADHGDNLTKLRRLTGWTGDIDPAQLEGRVGWRLQADDRLPLLGPLPDLASAGRPVDQPRRMPRQPGLWVFTALGSRGLTQAALGAEVLASWLTGDPVPAPAALLDALDPARFATRAARQAARGSSVE